jgi:predicted RNA binding protein YcfA (HicA-like mRNA interferase family)
VTWAEVIRKLKAAGFVEVRSGKGSHLLLKHHTTGKEVWVAFTRRKMPGGSAIGSCARRVSNDNALPDRPRN